MRKGVRQWSVVLGMCTAFLVPVARPAPPLPAPPPVAQAVPAFGAPMVAAADPAAGVAAAAPTAGPDCARLACVALTFDDGPSAATSGLLDDLADADVKATFFIVGEQARSFPEQLRREAAEGHAIGNHTLTHPFLTTLTPAQVHDELAQSEDAIAGITGSRPLLVRPPYGSYSAAVRSFGHPLVLWDVDTRDWQHHDPAQVLSRAAAMVHPGSIVLMHDTEGQLSTLGAVPQLIRNLRAAGYTLVTVPELLAPASPAPGAVYRNRDSATRPADHLQPWDTAPATTDQDTDAAIAGTVAWQYPTGAADGPAEAERVESGLRPGECRNTLAPQPAPQDTPAFALRNSTGHDLVMYDRADCDHWTAVLTPGGEQYAEVRSFSMR
ncbi:peptidoglycan/xylan/chitin deacetylase (PgdA/CDA1 family) [Kitasatospora sp. MAP12-15]|uniref:polysaccharide deacetylase family protein n=1 Tax=unclassified Kitasatospora TaxID=2633591 RepID=UPI0024734941|nr:polysaccharide deacetylase family protein [Kitasatospora sp. MAP12-44]MDH6115070.1 peptidoglycan/xylan/chitin deacetylase (PgdA/CDA1 family) [Kitasatospora sp. MAP12-44]